MTIIEIMQRSGGTRELARKCPMIPPVPCKTIYSWRRIGIPEWHWWWVAPIAGVTVADLHTANENLRRSRRPLGRRPRAEVRAA
jgi:hypothetical protein